MGFYYCVSFPQTEHTAGHVISLNLPPRNLLRNASHDYLNKDTHS